MWEQTLSGLIKALRANKDDEKRVILQSLSEIANEVKSTDLNLKAGAILKLCYLDMLGYPQLSSYSFNVIECMSSTKFYIKQIGYLAASQSFGPNTEVSMLTTNLVKKDLVSHSNSPMSFLTLSNSNLNLAPVLCLTLSSLPHLLNSQNSADLTPDLVSMLNHSKPIIKKRAITAIHALARADQAQLMEEEANRRPNQGTVPAAASPGVMDVWVERLREKLLDEDVSVVSSAVNVICELALKYPWPWLEVAAELYDLLKLKNNNWMMIKIVKIFTALTPIEPRLTKKLLPALTDLISTTSAMSLLYECIHTILAGGMLTHSASTADSHNLAKTCIEKLANFLDHADQNLRYMALVGLNKLLSSHSHLLEDHLDTILVLVYDLDPMLTARALDLIEGIKYQSHTLQNTVDYLMNNLEGRKPRPPLHHHGASDAMRALMSLTHHKSSQQSSVPDHPNHKIRIIHVVITICSNSAYSNISDFDWFLDVLVRLIHISVSLRPQEQTAVLASSSRTSGTTISHRLSNTLMDVSSRVRDIRPHAVSKMLMLLHDDVFLANIRNDAIATILPCTSAVSNPCQPDEKDQGSVSSLVTTAIWICGEYSDFEHVDLKDVISTLFKRELIIDSSSVLPQVSTFALHNGLKVFVKWLRGTVGPWYTDPPSDDDYSPNDVLERSQSAGISNSASQSPKHSKQHTELAQLNKLISAIVDRARELVKQKSPRSPDGLFVGIDHTELFDRANEVEGMMSLISRELRTFQPPTHSTSHGRSSNLDHTDPTAPYGLSAFGEANPFATQSGSPEGGFHRPFTDDGFRSKTEEGPSEPAMPQPPYWYTMLSDLFFIYELKPVANDAQKMIRPPDELDLDSWIPYLTTTVESLESHDGVDDFGRKAGASFANPYQLAQHGSLSTDQVDAKKPKKKRDTQLKISKKKGVVDKEALAKTKLERIERQRADPFYITSTQKNKQKASQASLIELNTSTDLLNIDEIPIVKLDLSDSDLKLPAPRRSQMDSSSSMLGSRSSSAGRTVPPLIDAEGEMPNMSYLDKYARKPIASTSASNSVDQETQRLSESKGIKTDEVHVTHTPESVKVVKRKLASKKKKKPSSMATSKTHTTLPT